MLHLNENASRLWFDTIYTCIIWDNLGKNGISQRWRFAFHFTSSPGAAAFPRGMGRDQPQEKKKLILGAAGSPGRVLPLLPPVGSC